MRLPPNPCEPTCPGWGVFDVETRPSIQRCDDCWAGVADAPTDADYENDAECLAELGREVLDHVRQVAVTESVGRWLSGLSLSS